MLKIYALVIILAILGGVGYGAKYYYDTTQNTIATLRENNAQLEIAADVAQESVNNLQADMKKLGEINNQLQASLQRAEAYGDELRSKLTKLNLVVEALKDSKVLEGKMNGATAKLWRGLMGDTGGTDDVPLPSWLQQSPSGTGDQNSSEGRENTDTNSDSSEATPAK